MPRRLAAILLLAAIAPGLARSGTGKAEARAAAGQFGAALTGAQTSSLRPILPTRGKVRLALVRLAQEEGSFGAGQVEAVFRDSLAVVIVKSFEVVRLESDEKTFAVVHARVVLKGRDGRPARVSLHLSFQPESDAWVLREIKESME